MSFLKFQCCFSCVFADSKGLSNPSEVEALREKVYASLEAYCKHKYPEQPGRYGGKHTARPRPGRAYLQKQHVSRHLNTHTYKHTHQRRAGGVTGVLNSFSSSLFLDYPPSPPLPNLFMLAQYNPCPVSDRFAKLLLRLPALRSIGLKCLEHLFFFKLIGDTPIDTFLMEMLEAPHQMT